MKNPFAIRTILFRSGERFPLLVAAETGEPDFDTTVYVLTQLRATNKATNTIEHHLRAIVVLKLFLCSREIDLEERIRSGLVLQPHELDELVKFCKRPLPAALSESGIDRLTNATQTVVAAEFKRNRRTEAVPEVCTQTGVNRVHAIRSFLDWLVRERAAQFTVPVRNNMIDAWEQCRTGLAARISSRRRRNQIGLREGADQATIALLFKVIATSSEGNPWRSDRVRVRNQLLILWLYQLGIRRGELLNIKIADIDFKAETVTIARRADDMADPRRHQPLVKTRDRKLPLASSLASMTLEYITRFRAQCPGARLHQFLFVSDRTGAPLSLSMVNDVFSDIRDSFPDSFKGLSPHVLRHTWNDNFSARIDELKLQPGEETHMRSFLMGWSPTSDTATTYTRRHIRKRAQSVSLAMQAKIMGTGGRDE